VQRQGVQPPYGIFSASASGVLVYQTGANAGSLGGSRLTWVGRTGAAIGTVGEPGDYSSVALSPDATQAVVGELVPRADLWTVDLARGVKTRLTFGSSQVFFPVWSPDGRIAFASARSGRPNPNLYVKAANGTGGEDPLIPPGALRLSSDWSHDGRYVLFAESESAAADGNLMALPMQGDRKPFVVLSAPFRHFPATFSPDGRWIAYTSNESGRNEVYVTPFLAPGAAVTGGKQQVSPGGGDFARWRPDGREIYYVSLPPDETLMAAEVSAHDNTFTIGAVKALFRMTRPVGGAAQGWFYDVAPDGKRFLIIAPQPVKTETASPPTIVLNWVPHSR